MAITTANEIQSACRVGLILFGQNKDKQPEWVGTREKFEKCYWIMDNVEIMENLKNDDNF